jgi:hypothetical protein
VQLKGVIALNIDEHNPHERADSKIETSRDDRYSSWNDQRYRIKYGWRQLFSDFKRGDWWEGYKQSLGSYLGPWPMPLVIFILVIIYFIRKFFDAH